MSRPASRSHRARVTAGLGLVSLLGIASQCELAVSLDGLQGGCPPLRGAAQVEITTGSSPFCIDATEATNAQYQQFLSSGATIAQAGAPDSVCDGIPATLTPSVWPPPAGSDDFPVTNVNWCQAYAFCKWAGKRLCGQIGGGALVAQDFDVASQSQWLNACSMGGKRAYPYGQTFQQDACGGSAEGSMVQSVTFSPSCVGPLPGLYDMSGNVWEWTDTCGQGMPTAATAFCDAMGGAFDSTQNELECVGERNWTRNAGAANIGIRCCLDL